MVRRLLTRITAPVRGLHEAAYVLAALTLASQALAILRDRAFAHSFGAGQTLDLYYAAFKIPDLVFALVASLVSAYVLIPRIAEASGKDARELMSQTATFLLVGGGIICAVLALFAPHLLFLLFPGFADIPERASFILLARILLLQPILLGLSGVVTSVTQVHRRFALFALSPVLYNLGIIFGTVFLYPLYGLPGIGIGVVIGAVAHLAIHLPVVAKAGLFPRLVMPDWRTIFSVMKDSVPRSLALGAGAATTLALTALAARSGTGGVSVFTLGGNLEAVPLSLIGASYAVAAFPVLSELAGKDDKIQFSAVLSSAARHLMVWSIVTFGLVVVLRAHLVRAILGTGAFGWDATRLTAAVLAILVVALAAQGLVLLLSRALYAAKQSWSPLTIQVAGGILSLFAAGGLLWLAPHFPGLPAFVDALFRVSGVAGTSVLLIAIGATVGQLLIAVLLVAALSKAAPGFARTLVRPLFEGLAAALVGGCLAYGVLALLGGLAPLTTTVAVFTEGFAAGMVGLAGAIGVLYFTDNREFAVMREALIRAAKKHILPPLGL
ncbi:MAG: lipid II flippase MurJ [bacterium]